EKAASLIEIAAQPDQLLGDVDAIDKESDLLRQADLIEAPLLDERVDALPHPAGPGFREATLRLLDRPGLLADAAQTRFQVIDQTRALFGAHPIVGFEGLPERLEGDRRHP